MSCAAKSAPEDCRRKNVVFKEMRRDGETRPRFRDRYARLFDRCVEHFGRYWRLFSSWLLVAGG